MFRNILLGSLVLALFTAAAHADPAADIQAADKKLEIWRGQTMQDGKGRRTGRNQGRPDVTKAINQVAYESEPPR